MQEQFVRIHVAYSGGEVLFCVSALHIQNYHERCLVAFHCLLIAYLGPGVTVHLQKG